jgi:hypothetical protein
MPWTTPRTWVATEVVTASILNRELRDNLAYLYLHYLMPVEGIVWFNTGSCPSGYSEVTAARGRIIVGLNPGGTNGATAGPAALSNLGTISVSSISPHVHSLSSLGSTAGAGDHAHNIPVTSPGAVSNIGLNTSTPSGSGQTDSVLDHSHSFSGTTASTGSASAEVTTPYIQYIVCKRT